MSLACVHTYIRSIVDAGATEVRGRYSYVYVCIPIQVYSISVCACVDSWYIRHGIMAVSPGAYCTEEYIPAAEGVLRKTNKGLPKTSFTFENFHFIIYYPVYMFNNADDSARTHVYMGVRQSRAYITNDVTRRILSYASALESSSSVLRHIICATIPRSSSIHLRRHRR